MKHIRRLLLGIVIKHAEEFNLYETVACAMMQESKSKHYYCPLRDDIYRMHVARGGILSPVKCSGVFIVRMRVSK